MSEKMLRIGFVGAGENTRLRHLPGFKALPGVGLAAVANRSRESSERVARDFGIGRVAADWREIVAAPDVDAVCIGTWPYLHAEVSIAALRAGKHVLTEARMARDAGEAAAMCDALAEARKKFPGIVAQIVPAPMTLGVDATVARLLREGEIGVVREVIVEHTHGAQAGPAAPFTWRQSLEWSGHNIMTMGIHYEALLRWFDDDAEVLAADGRVFTAERPGPGGEGGGAMHAVGIPESLTVLGRFPRSGARLVMHLSGVETISPRNEIRINGSEGGLRIDVGQGTLWLTRRGRAVADAQPVEPAPGERGGWRVEADFVESIRSGAPVRLTDFPTGLRYMHFTDAVWKRVSARPGQVRSTE